MFGWCPLPLPFPFPFPLPLSLRGNKDVICRLLTTCSSTCGSGLTVTISGAVLRLMTGNAVGEYLEMKAPHAAHVLFLPLRIDPHDWQISISTSSTPRNGLEPIR